MTFRKLHLPSHGVHLYESKHAEGDIVDLHHHDVHQLLYGLEGEGQLTLNGVPHPFGQDIAALIVPYAEHAIVTGSKLTLLVLAFHRASFDAFAQEELLAKSFGSSSMLRPNAFSRGELRRLLRKMLYEQSLPDALGAYAMKLYLHELLLELVRSRRLPQATDANSLRAERIRFYIDTHFFEPITTNDLAARMGISARHVSSIFKDQYGQTPSQYLTEVRIGIASRLLLETDKDIVSICFEVGYETLSAFYRSFKTIVGASPRQFRQSAQQRGE